MSDILCGYHDREATLLAYLYDEIAPDERAAFDAHLASCARCRVELNGLGGVRAQLARWAPPDYSSGPQFQPSPSAAGQSVAAQRRPPVFELESEARDPQVAERESFWRAMPVWAQAAAAVLLLGASLGIANLNVHYDAQNGLNIRTGWSNNNSNGSIDSKPAALNGSPATADANLASRSDLVALEQQLRREIQAVSAAPARSASANDGDVPRRVKAMLDESERRHERELALRVAEVIRDVNAQRQADLRRIDQNLGLIEGRTGVEVLKNRQMIDMYLQRVSQRQ